MNWLVLLLILDWLVIWVCGILFVGITLFLFATFVGTAIKLGRGR